ncbi:MAG: ABC transporter permease subunit, partial [Methanomassiliicoccales archaeon]
SSFYAIAYTSGLIWLLIILAQSVVALPVIFRLLENGFRTIPNTLTDAARTLGGNPLFEVDLPLASQAFAAALVFGFAMSLGEFTSTNFLATSKYITLSVEIYALRTVRLFSASNMAALLLLIISLFAFYVIQVLGEGYAGIRRN